MTEAAPAFAILESWKLGSSFRLSPAACDGIRLWPHGTSVHAA